MEQSTLIINSRIFSFNVLFHRRDFRSARMDPTTKQIVSNPVKWLEMNNIEIV
jgi:hypothetical protein